MGSFKYKGHVYKTGDVVTAKLYGSLATGKLVVPSGNFAYICQNKKNGGSILADKLHNKMGYKFAWAFYKDDPGLNNYVTELKPANSNKSKPSKSNNSSKPSQTLKLVSPEKLYTKFVFSNNFTSLLPAKLIAAIFKRYETHFDRILSRDLGDDDNYESGFELFEKSKLQFVTKYPALASKMLDLFLVVVLDNWKDSSGGAESAILTKLKPILDLLKKKKLANIELSTKYKVAYRGTRLKNVHVAKFIRATKQNDWRKVVLHNQVFFAYAKKKFPYKPHRNFQSWTVDPRQALEFSSTYILAANTSKNRKDFYFDPVLFTKKINTSYSHEMETLHYGKNLSVVLAISEDDFTEYWSSDIKKIPKYDSFIQSAV